MRKSIEVLRTRIETARQHLQNNEETEFIPITIPTLMSIWETERLLQALRQYNIGAKTIVVNQINPLNDACEYCKLKNKLHSSIIDQLKDLYKDEYEIHQIEMSKEEIRGIEKLKEFLPKVVDILT